MAESLEYFPVHQSTSKPNPNQLAPVSPITRGVWPILERIINEADRTLFGKHGIESVSGRDDIFLYEPRIIMAGFQKLEDQIVETLWDGQIM